MPVSIVSSKSYLCVQPVPGHSRRRLDVRRDTDVKKRQLIIFFLLKALTNFLKYNAIFANSSLRRHRKFMNDVGYPTTFSASLMILLQFVKGGLNKIKISSLVKLAIVDS